MSTLRHVGFAKDANGYPGEVLEDSATGARYFAYSPETWDQRLRDHEAYLEEERREARLRERQKVRALHAESPTPAAAD